MSARSRLRRLGVDGTPRFECMSCGGTGTVTDSDTPCVGARLQWTMDRVLAELAGEPPPDVPEPDCSDDPRFPCAVCRGAGVASIAAATRWRLAAEDTDRRMLDDMLRVVESMNRYRIVDVAPAESTPRLRAVASGDDPSRH